MKEKEGDSELFFNKTYIYLCKISKLNNLVLCILFYILYLFSHCLWFACARGASKWRNKRNSGCSLHLFLTFSFSSFSFLPDRRRTVPENPATDYGSTWFARNFKLENLLPPYDASSLTLCLFLSLILFLKSISRLVGKNLRILFGDNFTLQEVSTKCSASAHRALRKWR